MGRASGESPLELGEGGAGRASACLGSAGHQPRIASWAHSIPPSSRVCSGHQCLLLPLLLRSRLWEAFLVGCAHCADRAHSSVSARAGRRVQR